MINELYAMTDNVLDLARIKRDLENKKLCGHWNCGVELGAHGHIGFYCPTEKGFSKTQKFIEVRCEGPSGMGVWDCECGKECVPGERYCAEHAKEAE